MFYYLVPYLDGARRRYKSKREAPMNMELTKNFGEDRVSLCQLDPDVPHKMLGIHIEPAESNTTQLSRMKKKCKKWNSRMLG